MPLMFLIDEHLRGDFYQALVIAARAKGFTLDIAEIGDDDCPPLGTKDPALLLWCQSASRVLVSRDVNSLPDHLQAHIASGHHCPGIFLIRPNRNWPDVLDDLVLLAVASDAGEYADRIIFIPL